MGVNRALRFALPLYAAMICAALSLNAETRLESYEIGVGGVVRAGEWNRFELVISSIGEPFEGEARVSLGGMSAARALLIPAGGSLRWESAARAPAIGAVGSLALKSADGNERVFPLEFQPNANEIDAVVLTVAARRGAFHAAFQMDAQAAKVFETGAADSFPESWVGWKSVDALVWFAGDVPLNRLRPQQQEALRRWIQRGGAIAVVLDDSTRGALPAFWEALLPANAGRRRVGLGSVARYEGLGPRLWSEVEISARPDEGDEYLQRLSERMHASDSRQSAALNGRRFALGAAVWVMFAALFWGMAVRFRSRLWWIGILALGAGVSFAPSVARFGSPLLTPQASGAARVFPETQEALWIGVIEAPPTDRRRSRIALPAEMRVLPLNTKKSGVRRESQNGGEIRGYSPSGAHSTFWMGEAFTPFVGEIIGGKGSGGKYWALNKTPLQFERAAVAADGRVRQIGPLPPGERWEGELQPLRSLRALWSGLETPSRALAFWARESRLNRLIPDNAPFFIGWTRKTSPFTQNGTDQEILLVVYPLSEPNPTDLDP